MGILLSRLVSDASCFIDCCVAHGDRIDNERMDMINAPQAPECHVIAELWLHLATC